MEKIWGTEMCITIELLLERKIEEVVRSLAGGGGGTWLFLGGYVPPRTPNWHPVLTKISPKIDNPF